MPAQCTCIGCGGNGRKNSPAHEGPCTGVQQTGVSWGSYCKRCAPNYLCIRCETNAVPNNVVNGVCASCFDKRKFWCQCPGCGEGDSRHVHYKDTGSNVRYCLGWGSKKGGDHYFCTTCITSWACTLCGAQIRSPKPMEKPPLCATPGSTGRHRGKCYHEYEFQTCPCSSALQCAMRSGLLAKLRISVFFSTP